MAWAIWRRVCPRSWPATSSGRTAAKAPNGSPAYSLRLSEKIRAIAEYSAELLSQAEHRARGPLSGIDFLRSQIRGALELLQSRLYSLERARRFGQQFAHAGFGAIHAIKR